MLGIIDTAILPVLRKRIAKIAQERWLFLKQEGEPKLNYTLDTERELIIATSKLFNGLPVVLAVVFFDNPVYG